MSDIRITVGAQADASFSRVFAPLLTASAQAKAKVVADLGAISTAQARAAKTGGDAQEREARRVAAAAGRAYRSVEQLSANAAAKEVADANRAAQAKVAAAKREFDARLRAAQKARADESRAADKAAKDAARIAAQAERQSIQMAAREQARKDREARNAVKTEQRMHTERVRAGVRARREEEQERRKHDRAFNHVQGIRDRYEAGEQKSKAQRIKDVARGSMDNLKFIGREAMGLGKAGFQAAGVQFDPATLMQRAIDLESSVTATTISAMTGKGQVASASDISGTMAAVKGAGNASKQDYGQIAAGLSDFVSKSGDLDTGKKALAELGLIARATGADVGDLISAAGDVSKTLADTPDKAERLLTIMRLVAKQGAMGSVEIKDLAKYMGNITASAFMFEGGVDQNIGILGGLAQVSMKGGATTAAEGTRAANSFARDITKEAALKRFEDAGIQVFADKDRKKLLSPEKIITDFMQKTGGSLDDLASLFQNEMSRKVLKGYSQIYDEAGGGQAGIDAIKAKFKQMATGMTSNEVRAAAGVSMAGKAANAQAFQNKLEDLGMELADKLLPALTKLEPTILKLADAFVQVVAWATENPGKAISAAIVGSIAKAAIGSAVGSALTSLISGGGIGGGSLGGVAGVAGKGGLRGAGAALGMAGVAIAGVSTLYDAYGKYKQGDTQGALGVVGESGFATSAAAPFGQRNSIGASVGGVFGSALPPPPTTGQPAGTPPTLTAPPPNPIPTLQEVAGTLKQTNTLLGEVAKNTAAGAVVGSGINSAARTGPGKK